MKRFHVHIAVQDLNASIDFYSKLFGQQPSKQQADYAKWMLEDPRINFAISARGHAVGLNHFGFQVDSSAELDELQQRAEAASAGAVLDQGETTCCYANSTKHWTLDPQGLAWEHFHTLADAIEFGSDAPTQGDAACCIPIRGEAACCIPNTVNTQGGCCG